MMLYTLYDLYMNTVSRQMWTEW